MIANLMKEHAELRRLAAELEEAMGPEQGAGWDDCTSCDMAKMKAKQEQLAKGLIEHEAKETSLLNAAFRRERDHLDERTHESEMAHRTLTDLMHLLKTVTSLYDGRHAYALRGAVRRVRDELEHHLRHEEEVMFPLLKEKSHRKHGSAAKRHAAAK